MEEQQKSIIYSQEARNAIEKGVNAVADIVKITLGPKGRNVLLDQKYLAPLITNDGVTIAKEVHLSDPFENMGAELIKEVCIKTNDVAGDGTTTAIVFSQALIGEGLKNFTAGANPILLNNGIRKACEKCVQLLKNRSKHIENDNELKQIATISAGSEEIGEIIANALKKVGKDGVITIEESSSLKTELKVVEGMQFDRGFLSPYMSTDLEKMEVVYDNAKILITEDKPTIAELLPILEQIAQNGQRLLIICEDLDNETLSALVINKMRGAFSCAVVKAPAYGDKKTALLQDMACLCNTKVCCKQRGDDIRTLTLNDLGSMAKVKVTKDDTTLIGQKTSPLLQERIAFLKDEIQKCTSDIDKDSLKKRLAKLCGGIAVLYVGAQTEVEMKEKKLRIEDALNATTSAIQEGVISGGGVALLKTQKELDKLIKILKGDEKTGAQVVLKATQAPIRQILKNAGLDDGIIVEKILKNSNINYGYDALHNKFGDMLINGIIDPTKVTTTALSTACSVATTLLTTEGMIISKQKNT